MMGKILKPTVYWLLAFIVVTFVLESMHASSSVVFFAAAISIIPIAKGIGSSTEKLSVFTGPAVGGLLNATFGNAPELIICIVALKAGLYEIVLASLTGAVMSNLLLGMGVSFTFGGIKHHVQSFNVQSIRLYGTIMFIAVISMAIPSGFSNYIAGKDDLFGNAVSVNIGFAVVLLIAYGLYLYFMLKTHKDIFKSEEEEESPKGKIYIPLLMLALFSVGAAIMGETIVGVAEEAGKEMGMTTTFVSLVFISIVGGAAETFSAIDMAGKNKTDLSVGILMGSCIQLTLFVAPVLVLLSFLIGPAPMFLAFTKLEINILMISVFITMIISADGNSNWFKGVQLIVMYLLMAITLFFLE
ncbi:MAG: calcium/proton exchanger [Ignavibacteria bacterium]|nr:calcium/proton exchanger [Ignavibacteria bacterium]